MTYFCKDMIILCKSYSKEELAELLLYAVDVIQGKNKLLEQKNG